MNDKFFHMAEAGPLFKLLAALVVISLICVSNMAYAKEITYTGNGKQLQEVPSWLSYEESDLCLFPGTRAAPLSSDNKVTVNYNPSAADVTNIDLIFGGLSESGDTSNNSVVLLSGYTNSIFGGFTEGEDSASRNAVTVNGGNARDSIFGGFSNRGSAKGNRVLVIGGSVGRDVCGGLSFSDNDNAEILDNAVTVSGGYIAAWVVGGAGQGRVARNMVTINGGSVYSDVFGGHGDNHSTTDNTVTIRGGSVNGGVCGGYSGGDGEVLRNRVIISGGVIKGKVAGGYSKRGEAVNNIVEVSGGSVLELVCGGAGDGDGDASYNTVTISGKPGLGNAYIRGGEAFGIGDAFTGNTLNFKSSGIVAVGVDNFEYYNFYLPESLTAGAVMLGVTEPVDLKETTVEIFLQGGTKLREGDKIALIHSAAGVKNSPKNKIHKVCQGGVFYEFSIYTDSNNLWAKVETVSDAVK